MQDWNAHWHFWFLMMILKSPQFHMPFREAIALYGLQTCRKLQWVFSITTGVIIEALCCHPWLGKQQSGNKR